MKSQGVMSTERYARTRMEKLWQIQIKLKRWRNYCQDLLNPDNNQNEEIPEYRLDQAANEQSTEPPSLDDTKRAI